MLTYPLASQLCQITAPDCRQVVRDGYRGNLDRSRQRLSMSVTTRDSSAGHRTLVEVCLAGPATARNVRTCAQ